MDNNFNDGINLTMLTDFYEITMANGYFETGMAEKIAYFDMFFRKKGNFNRPSVYFTYNRMSVRLNIIFGVQLFAGVQLVFDQQSKNESY